MATSMKAPTKLFDLPCHYADLVDGEPTAYCWHGRRGECESRHVCPSFPVYQQAIEGHRRDDCTSLEGRKASWRDVVAAIKAERERQGLRWGSKHDSCHSLMDWLSIIGYELDEAIAEAHEDRALTELRHIAAVAAAAMEWCGVTEED